MTEKAQRYYHHASKTNQNQGNPTFAFRADETPLPQSTCFPALTIVETKLGPIPFHLHRHYMWFMLIVECMWRSCISLIPLYLVLLSLFNPAFPLSSFAFRWVAASTPIFLVTIWRCCTLFPHLVIIMQQVCSLNNGVRTYLKNGCLYT